MKFSLRLLKIAPLFISLCFSSHDATEELSESEKWDYVREIGRRARLNINIVKTF
jgi:hypothetical protein